MALRTDASRPLALYGRGLARIAKGDVKAGEAEREASYPAFSTYGLDRRLETTTALSASADTSVPKGAIDLRL